ncbi:MAG: bifunctional methylenetetrahydrofolate dehydrogenase/methenyltetrahydrofolate cyclohydrolase FolD [candidate division NC10 bacterium]|nr:bifunctional methylenetetrahydrofolate dehydrogenase/methenyltetrahydrofolate cyclohydrolase FolD [candidate division NC10 bacterium]
MAARIIDGKAIAAEIRREVRLDVAAMVAQTGVVPCLAAILVGNDPASATYVQNKARACKEVGITSVRIDLPADCSEASLLHEIGRLNSDPAVHAILVQLPLPPHISEKRVLETILPEKDVDGFHPANLGGLLVGKPLFVASTPLGILELLNRSNVGIEGKHAVIVGWSVVVGKPTAFLLLQHHATVTICHIKTRELASHTRQADILIVAAGKPGLVTGSMVKGGAVVIDVGVNRLTDGRVVGDVDFPGVAEKASLITPVPGGVGPMTVAMLLRNTVDACRRLCDARRPTGTVPAASGKSETPQS